MGIVVNTGRKWEDGEENGFGRRRGEGGRRERADDKGEGGARQQQQQQQARQEVQLWRFALFTKENPSIAV